jgi:ABC-type Fe3+-siderophore transport system permease subunit
MNKEVDLVTTISITLEEEIYWELRLPKAILALLAIAILALMWEFRQVSLHFLL